MRIVIRCVLCAFALGTALGAAVHPAWAQAARVWGTSSLQYVEFRSLVVDSVEESTVPGEGLHRSLPSGLVVRCGAGDDVCRFSRSGPAGHTVPTIHDVSATAWGFARGMRVYTRFLLRGEVAGQEGMWPRADDAFDLVLGFAEWNRPRVRIRAGRQWAASPEASSEIIWINGRLRSNGISRGPK